MATHSGILGLEKSVDRGAWRATVHRVAKSQTQLKRLSLHTLFLKMKEEVLGNGKDTQAPSGALPS